MNLDVRVPPAQIAVLDALAVRAATGIAAPADRAITGIAAPAGGAVAGVTASPRHSPPWPAPAWWRTTHKRHRAGCAGGTCSCVTP